MPGGTATTTCGRLPPFESDCFDDPARARDFAIAAGSRFTSLLLSADPLCDERPPPPVDVDPHAATPNPSNAISSNAPNTLRTPRRVRIAHALVAARC
jgi:hypothetical protein